MRLLDLQNKAAPLRHQTSPTEQLDALFKVMRLTQHRLARLELENGSHYEPHQHKTQALSVPGNTRHKSYHGRSSWGWLRGYKIIGSTITFFAVSQKTYRVRRKPSSGKRFHGCPGHFSALPLIQGTGGGPQRFVGCLSTRLAGGENP